MLPVRRIPGLRTIASCSMFARGTGPGPTEEDGDPMGDVVGDVVGFVEDAADVVVKVAETVTDPVSDVVQTVVSPIAEAVSAIPVVGDVVEMAAPFGGMIGTLVGGPLGSAIGNAVGDSFGDGGGGFDFIDTAIGMFGGDLPGPLADIAGNLLDGGSLIDNAASVFGGDIGGMAQNLLGGELGGMAQNLLGGEGGLGGIAQNILGGNMPDIGDLQGLAGQVLGDDMPDLGGLGDMAQNILGGNMPDIGDLQGLAGQVLGENMPDLGGLQGIVGQVLGEGAPDLSDIGGLGGLIKTADSVFGGLGLGNLGSAASGIVGDCMPDLSGAGGWLDNLPDSIPGMGGGGFELPFGCGTFPSIPDITGPITEGGGNWLNVIQQQAGQVADYLPGGCWTPIEEYVPDFGFGTPDSVLTMPDLVEVPNMIDRDNDLDDLVFNLPGVDRDGAARDALQSLAETGNLGEALASLSQDDLTTLVTRLVAPTASPAIETIVDNAATSGQAIDDLGLPASVVGDAAQQPAAADDFGDDLVTAGADAGLGGPDTAGQDAATSGLVGDDAATSGLAGQDAQVGGQNDFDDGLGLGGLEPAAGDGLAQPEPAAMETFTPEPEPQSDFSQQIAQADAVEDSFDNMFDDLGGTGQG
jgi:hypothetical protein